MSESVSDVGIEVGEEKKCDVEAWESEYMRLLASIRTVSGEASCIREYQTLWLQPLQTALSIHEM